MRIRTSITLAFAAAISGAVVLAGTTFYAASRHEIGQQVRLRATHLATSLRNRLDSGMYERVQALRTIGAHAAFLAARSPEQVAPLLSRLQGTHRAYAWIGFVDGAGRVSAPTSAPRELDATRLALIARLENPQVTATGPEGPALRAAASAMPPATFAEIAVPARDAEGTQHGVLVAQVTLAWVRELAAEVLEAGGASGHAELLVVGGDRRILAGPAAMQGRLLPAALGGLEEAAEREWPDGRYATAHSAARQRAGMPTLEWSVVARMDPSVAYGRLHRIAEYLALAGFALVLAGSGAAALFATRLARPMERWAAAADRIGAGDAQVGFPEFGGSFELRRLSAALKSMAQRLAQKEEALQARIAERTAQLEESSRSLESQRELLAEALAASRLASWDLDAASGEVRLSAEWARMLGAPPGCITTTVARLAERVPLEEHAMLYRAAIALRKGSSEHYDVEHRFRRDDGRLIWIRSRGRVTLRTAEGIALRVTGTNAEITARKDFETALREREKRLNLVTENLPVMICFLDRDFRFLYANRRYLEFFGLDEAHVFGHTLEEVAGPEAQRITASFLPRLQAGESLTHERHRIDRHGAERHFEVRLVPHHGAEAEFLGFFSLIDDVTERRRAERELVAGAERLRMLTDGVSSLIAHLDLEGRILFVNRRYREFFKLPEHPEGMAIWQFVGADAETRFKSHLDRIRAGQAVTYEREASSEGKTCQFELHLSPQRGADGTVEGVYAVANDITAHKTLARLLQQQALSDPLTELPNRRLFGDRLHHAIAKARRLGQAIAVLYVDLNGFKAVNDTYGHASGDTLLRQVAARLAGCVRDSDTLARIGGDEFGVILDAVTSPESAETVAVKLLHVLDMPFGLDNGVDVRVSCCIGLALYPDDATDQEALMRAADAAMYAAKSRHEDWRRAGR